MLREKILALYSQGQHDVLVRHGQNFISPAGPSINLLVFLFFFRYIASFSFRAGERLPSAGFIVPDSAPVSFEWFSSPVFQSLKQYNSTPSWGREQYGAAVYS